MKTKQFLSYYKLLIGLAFVLFVGCNNDDLTDINNYTYDGETVTDIDGNVYNTVTIGDQVWLAENLKVITYNDGTAIPQITGNDAWIVDTLGAYCNYDNDENNVNVYGRLYNWYTVRTDKLCPEGWHVPASSQWDELVDFIKSDSIYKSDSIGLVLKAPYLWSNNGGGTDNYQFRALPGGSRSGFNGKFNDMGDYGFWWSSDGGTRTEITSTDTITFDIGRYVLLNYFSENIRTTGMYKSSLGHSVRCIKD